MKALELREAYENFFYCRGYVKLPEKTIINEEEKGPYFNGSALTPNIGYFLGTTPLHSNSMFTQQRVFWTRHADIISHNPVWTIMQVMMSFYQFQRPNLQEALSLMSAFLFETLGIPKERLYVIVKNDPNMIQNVKESGFLTDRIVAWDKMTQFKAEDLTGTYVRIVIQHKHGLLPIWDLIYMEDGTLYNMDSCMLLERTSFVLQQKTNWFETEMFLPLIQSLVDREGSRILVNQVADQVSILLRSIVCALGDGVVTTSKGPGYVLKKIIRSLLGIMDRNGLNTSLEKFTEPTLQCLKNIGYDFYGKSDQIKETLYAEELSYRNFCKQVETFLKKEIQRFEAGKREKFTMEDLEKWKDSRGIPEEHANEVLQRHGFTIEEIQQREKEKRVFLTDLYPYNTTKRIENPFSVLQWMEHQY
jgi:alanyl-tRNA synthetase